MQRHRPAGIRPWIIRTLLVLTAMLPLLAAPVSAQPAAETATPAPATAHQAFLAELEGIIAHEEEQLSLLHAEFEAAPDDEAALAVQRRIADLRQGSEIALLGAQARYARQLGRAELAQRLEADMAELRDPQRAAKKARADDTSR